MKKLSWLTFQKRIPPLDAENLVKYNELEKHQLQAC